MQNDTTPYECGKNYDEVINKVEDTIERLFNWFQCNKFKVNASKCCSFLLPYKQVTTKIKESAIESSNIDKLLGVAIDRNCHLMITSKFYAVRDVRNIMHYPG